jgi:hypothetical protein
LKFGEGERERREEEGGGEGHAIWLTTENKNLTL